MGKKERIVLKAIVLSPISSTLTCTLAWEKCYIIDVFNCSSTLLTFVHKHANIHTYIHTQMFKRAREDKRIGHQAFVASAQLHLLAE